jgi:hypothetical protein
MTTAEQIRDAVSRPGSTVPVAGVPWPAYKVVSLLLGLTVFMIVGLATAAAAPAVLTATAVSVIVWLTLGAVERRR